MRITKNRPREHTFSHFAAVKNAERHPLIDKLVSNNLSIFLAFMFYKMGLTANNVTVFRGVLSVIYLIFVIFLPSESVIFPILAIFFSSYFIFLLDCADGQLARATETESRFGGFLDICIDNSAHALLLGGFFCYTYKYFENIGDIYYMKMSLVVGFFFVISRISESYIWREFLHVYGNLHDQPNNNSIVHAAIKNLFSTQSSIFGFLLFPVSPTLAFLFFIFLAMLATASCLRFLWRAHRAG